MLEGGGQYTQGQYTTNVVTDNLLQMINKFSCAYFTEKQCLYVLEARYTWFTVVV